jgi:hypothetical protein
MSAVDGGQTSVIGESLSGASLGYLISHQLLLVVAGRQASVVREPLSDKSLDHLISFQPVLVDRLRLSES